MIKATVENIVGPLFIVVLIVMVTLIAALSLSLVDDEDPDDKRGYGRPAIACIDGVEYITKYRGDMRLMTGHFKPDGSLYTCSEVK